jgi:metal-sulfur cluster biosynthetic enzyme
MVTAEQVWEAFAEIPDPEIPAVSSTSESCGT